MRYIPRLSLSVWALLALLTGTTIACLSPALGADQKPLVINPTTGRTEQMQSGNNLLVPGPVRVRSGMVGAFSVATASDTSAPTVTAWDSTLHSLLCGPSNGGTAGALAASYNQATNETHLISLSPGVAWRALNVWGDSFRFGPTGSTNIGLFISNGGVCQVLGATGTTLIVSSTQDSTSKDTGSIVTDGGIGSEKAITTGTNFIAGVAGGGLLIKEGSNAKMGAATLVGGTVTVNTTAVTANSRIYLTSQVDGGTPGYLRVSGRVAATSFTITSGSGTDTSTVAWMIVEPAP